MNGLLWLLIGGAAAFFLAWNNGSNNAANAIGTAIGARIINLKKALVIAAIFDFLGAMLFGAFVSKTIMKGIVDVTVIQDPLTIFYGMLAAVIATGLWVLISSILKIPMSISEGIVGGVIGFGITAVGVSAVDWTTVSFIFGSWAFLPAFSAAVAWGLYYVYDRMFRMDKLLVHIAWSSAFLLVFSTIFLLMVKTLKLSDLGYVLAISLPAALVAGVVFGVYARVKLKNDLELARDSIIKVLMILTMASMSFSHGANDVANSAGPLTAMYLAVTEGNVPKAVNVDPLMLTICAAGIAIGIVSWGSRVVGTIGEDITTLTYSSAFTAQLSASISVLILTRLGMPVSTTMAIVGAVAGVGLARGIKAVNLRTLIKIFSAWIIAVPIVAGGSGLLYYIFSLFGR